MRILFFDLSGLDYTTETPRNRPLGGSQSAICYLAEELALRGHRPAIVNSTKRPGIYRRGEPPILVYSSMPFRGLDVLLAAFPAIRAAVPGARLRIFSSMDPYQTVSDPYRPLYSQAETMVGVEYVGAVGQGRLANELAG